MPITPNLLERLVLLRLNRGPGPILDLFGAGAFEAVALALDMGVFESLADEPATPATLAARLDADERGLEGLLGYLAVQGYVERAGDRYRTTDMTDRWLVDSSPQNFGPWLTFWKELVFPFWAENLETAVREGGPEQTIYEWLGDDETQWAVAQRGFRAAAAVIADEVADAVDVPDGARSLLDVGGGHGLYAVRLCERYPDLQATVFDDPAALDVARDEAATAGLGDRVRVEGGDYETDDLGDGYDLALVFNVVHAHDEAAAVALLERVADALAPDGRIAVLDQLERSTRTTVGEAGLRFVDLTYLVTLDAQIHATADLREWLATAGFADVTETAIRRAGPGNVLVQARKPSD